MPDTDGEASAKELLRLGEYIESRRDQPGGSNAGMERIKSLLRDGKR